jgi:hypothetical protein
MSNLTQPAWMMNETIAQFDHYRTIPALADYIDRIAAETESEVDQRNYKRLNLVHREGRYKKDQHTITLAADGAVIAPKGLEPTEDEAASIKLAFADLIFPRSILVTVKTKAETQREKLGARAEDWFEIPDRSRSGIVMCQQRCEDKNNGKKFYLAWTLFNDGQWRQMEPDADKLPLWKPLQSRNKSKVMIHEGGKAARFVDQLVNDHTQREALAAHPWANELVDYEHWGWIGGAPNPYRTDWSEVLAEDPSEIVIVADHDLVGEQAIPRIARTFKSSKAPVHVIMFTNIFDDSFDLANRFPDSFWIKGRYRGPSLDDLKRSATWATRELLPRQGTQPHYVARDAFMLEWTRSTKPLVFINRNNPGRYLDTDQFNSTTGPFSDIKNTADSLRNALTVMVDGLAYEPDQNNGIISADGLRLMNMWTPTRIKRRKGGDPTPWLDFMTQLFPIEKDRAQVFRWSATLIARPDIKMKYGMLLISETQGVGKGTLMEKVFAPLVGWQNTSAPGEKQLTDDAFQSWIARRRLVIVHEIYAGNSKKAYNGLKSYVTDGANGAKMTVNEKMIPAYELSNWAHFVLSSNSEHALRLVKGDRRWLVPKVSSNKPGVEYWVGFNEWLITGGLEIIHEWAYDYVAEHGAVSAGDEAPTSDAKNRLIDLSLSEGVPLVLDLVTYAIMTRNEPIVVSDRQVRTWLGLKRNLTGRHDEDTKLESRLTIRGLLREAGMTELGEYKSNGVRSFYFASPKAMEVLKNCETNSNGLPRWNKKELGILELLAKEIVTYEQDDLNSTEPMDAWLMNRIRADTASGGLSKDIDDNPPT